MGIPPVTPTAGTPSSHPCNASRPVPRGCLPYFCSFEGPASCPRPKAMLSGSTFGRDEGIFYLHKPMREPRATGGNGGLEMWLPQSRTAFLIFLDFKLKFKLILNSHLWLVVTDWKGHLPPSPTQSTKKKVKQKSLGNASPVCTSLGRGTCDRGSAPCPMSLSYRATGLKGADSL